MMQVFGYVPGDESAQTPTHLSEVSVFTDSATLRSLTSFLTKYADLLDESSASGVKFGHEHFQDAPDEHEYGTDFIVCGSSD